jgi:hypothetical protein
MNRDPEGHPKGIFQRDFGDRGALAAEASAAKLLQSDTPGRLSWGGAS